RLLLLGAERELGGFLDVTRRAHAAQPEDVVLIPEKPGGHPERGGQTRRRIPHVDARSTPDLDPFRGAELRAVAAISITLEAEPQQHNVRAARYDDRLTLVVPDAGSEG